MARAICKIIVAGDAAEAVADRLRLRLQALDCGGRDMQVDSVCVFRGDSADALVFTPGRHDTPSFAAEKIIDELAARGLVHLDDGGLSPEEERQIRERLQALGYLE